ncbi:MAG: hypothetical protein CMJ58_25350 [Planctomycetaceae bacterium]|nr:hypothetical protein [Planctomycetaceae bacterium]
MTGNWKHCSGDEPGSGKASGDPYVDCRFVSSDGYSSFVLRPDACFAEQQMIGCSVLITAQSWDRAGYTVLSPREWCLTDEVTCIISNQLLATEKWHELARVLAAWERDPSQEFSVDLSAVDAVSIWICGEPRQDAKNESQERFRFVYESKARCFDMSFFVDQTCIRLARQSAALVACGFGDDGRKGAG